MWKDDLKITLVESLFINDQKSLNLIGKILVDIADVDVGRNIGAHLEADQAEADKMVAQAKAESKRAMAVAQEQEMKAKVQEMQAKVVESEAEVPLAMAHAFKNGNLGVFDYYNMQNVKADTNMRTAISSDDNTSNENIDQNKPKK